MASATDPASGAKGSNPWEDDDEGNDGVGVAHAAGTVVSATAGAVGVASGAVSSAIAATPLPWVLWILRVLNIGNAVLLGISAFESAFIIDGSITRAFLMVYQAVFGLLLLLFELRIGPVARWIKKQFGFMFTFSGRLVFLVFVGAVTFGMIHDRPTSIENASSWQYSMDWIIGVGIATLVNALINAAVICSHPAFRQDPQGRMTEEEAIKYLKEHPEALARVPGPETARSGGTASPASAPGRASSAPRADFGASSGGYTPPVAPAQAPAPNSTAAMAKGDSGFFGSADGGADAGDIDPFSAAPAPSPAPGGGKAADEGNHFDDEDDDDNPFA